MTPFSNNIIIAGYPKSGNTWVTRLTAELLECPVKGFWQEPHSYELACEGQNRSSEFVCFKAHHSLSELNLDFSSERHKVIYIIRDPRDVVISGANFFRFNRCPKLKATLEKMPLGKPVYSKILYNLIHSEASKIEQMTQAILFGNNTLSWCHIPWREHYQSYLDSPVLFVRYEDMLMSPERECARILHYLNQTRDPTFIKAAIKKQSFQVKKQEFIKSKEKYKAIFMRSGQSGEWRQKLSSAQKNIFRQCLSEDLKTFAYEA